MGLFQSSRSKHEAILNEEYLYGLVIDEMSNAPLRPGLMAKSLAESDGNEQRAKARYIKLRADQLKIEGAAIDELARQIKTNEQQAAKEVAARDKPQPKKPPQSSGNPIGSLLILGFIGLVVYMIFTSGSTKTETVVANPPAPTQQVGGSTRAVDAPSSPDQYKAALQKVMAKHPELNPDLPGHRQKLIEQLDTLIAQYTSRDYSKVRALEIAIWDMESGVAAISFVSRKTSQRTRAVPQNTIVKPQERDSFPNCIYKGVMTDADYRACGLNPPSTR